MLFQEQLTNTNVSMSVVPNVVKCLDMAKRGRFQEEYTSVDSILSTITLV